jgi:hypothetical protein
VTMLELRKIMFSHWWRVSFYKKILCM